MDANAPNAPAAPKPKRPKNRGQATEGRQQQARTKKAQEKRPAPSAVRSAPIRLSSDSNAPAEQFQYVFGPQEKAIHDYLRCVFQPDDHVARVPATRGSFELYTNLWRTRESGTCVAGSDGTAMIGVCAANWVEDGNNSGNPTLNVQTLGFTNMGNAVVASNNAATGYAATFNTVGAIQDPSAFSLPVMDVPTDTPLTSQTRIRLVAMELRIHSVMAATTSKGEVMLCGTVNPLGGVRAGSLNGNSWNDIVKTNSSVVTRAIRSLPNWKSGEVFSIVAIPAEDQAFEMCEIPASASTYSLAQNQYPVYNIGMLARSMTAGDTVNYEVTYVWESELAKSNLAESRTPSSVSVPASTLNLATGAARPYATLNRLPGVHTLPFMETLANVAPNALGALARHPALAKRPITLPMVADAVKGANAVVHHTPETGWFSRVIAGGKDLHKAVTSSGVLTAVPVIGGALQAVSSVLASLFD